MDTDTVFVLTILVLCYAVVSGLVKKWYTAPALIFEPEIRYDRDGGRELYFPWRFSSLRVAMHREARSSSRSAPTCGRPGCSARSRSYISAVMKRR